MIAWALLRPFVPAAAAAAIGAIAWNFTPFIGPAAVIHRHEAARIQASADLKIAAAALRASSAAIFQHSQRESTDVGARETNWSDQCKLAYQAGRAYACATAGGPPPVGVRTPAEIWDAGRFVPAPDHPDQH